MFSTL